MKTIRLIFKQSGDWYFSGVSRMGQDIWSCCYKLDTNETIRLNKDKDLSILYDVNKDITLSTIDITDEELDACPNGDLSYLRWGDYDYYTDLFGYSKYYDITLENSLSVIDIEL